jgi:sterol desaturase/sphingolipid hydroxylase (fatty acid hydroxylase superfamily)
MSSFSRLPTRIEKNVGRITRPIEKFSHQYLLAPNRWLLSKIDPISFAIEGTILKKILQVSIFPIFMVLTVVIGFELIKYGYTRTTFVGTVLMLLMMGVIFAPLERLIPFSRRWLDDKDEPTDVIVFFSNFFFERYLSLPIQLATIALIIEKISPTIGQDIWPTHWHPVVQVLLLLAVNDFFRYWYHRWMHENEFMWRWHSVHHSSERLYWFNGNRAHPFEPLVQSLLWGIPLAFVKAPVEIAFVAGLLGTTISRFQHTNMDVILGPFDYIFSSPKNHRYHHSKKIEEGNSNYGGDVIIWDLLFGTFHLPKGKQPSDDIGVGDMPNYPQNWIGLMMVPFNYNRIKKEAQQENILTETTTLPLEDDVDTLKKRKQP